MQKKIVNIYKIIVAFSLMTIIGCVALVLRIVSFGLLTNFNRKYVVPFLCKSSLFLIGMKLDNRLKLEQSKTRCFYTFNHNSYLDGFALMSLGLTNTRILMTERMLWYPPVTLVALSIGLLYVPTKKNKERRLRFFINLTKRVQKEKISIVGSSEGVHEYLHEIAEFNRGVYHMALLCELPIVAIFIYTPLESNPHDNFRPFKKGTIVLELIDIIPTDNWELKDLDSHIEEVRIKYVQKFNEHHKVKTV